MTFKNQSFLILFVCISLVLTYSSCSQKEDCSSCEIEEVDEQELEQAKIELGKRFFFDKRLSSDNTISCASCHDPNKAFTDGRALSTGVEGRLGFRNSPTLLNVNDATRFMFDAEIQTLEEQALAPIQDHVEMNMRMGDLVEKLKKNVDYAQSAQKIFNRELDAFVITRSLAAFQRTLISTDSRFDQFQKGESTVLSSEEKEGWRLFNSKGCVECHALPHFSDYRAHKIGLAWSEREDLGRFRVTADSADINAFKTPSLRNIELTGPYLHNGSVSSLEDMLRIHKYGDKGLTLLDINDAKMVEFNLENKFIIAFLKSLTDISYLQMKNQTASKSAD